MQPLAKRTRQRREQLGPGKLLLRERSAVTPRALGGCGDVHSRCRLSGCAAKWLGPLHLFTVLFLLPQFWLREGCCGQTHGHTTAALTEGRHHAGLCSKPCSPPFVLRDTLPVLPSCICSAAVWHGTKPAQLPLPDLLQQRNCGDRAGRPAAWYGNGPPAFAASLSCSSLPQHLTLSKQLRSQRL